MLLGNDPGIMQPRSAADNLLVECADLPANSPSTGTTITTAYNPPMDQARVRKLIERGLRAHRAGRVQDALEAYRKALKGAPEDAEALSLYGLALVHRGTLAEAEAPLRRAVALEPEQVGFRLNLIELLERRRDYAAALAEAEQILARAPRSARAWAKTGHLLAAVGRSADARDAFGRAVDLDPRDLASTLRLCRLEIAQRDLTAAARRLESARRLAPRHEALPRLELELTAAAGDWQRLDALARARLEAQPEDPAARHALAQAAFETGHYRRAMDAYRPLLAAQPENPHLLTAYARICLHAQEFDAALAALNRAEAVQPELPEMLAAKGLMLTYLGQFEAAERYTRRCLAQNPHYAPAYTQLSQLTRGRLDDAERRTLEELANADAVPAEHRATAMFALADAFDAGGDVDSAFDAYQRANRLRRERARSEGLGYDPAAMTARMDRIIELFDSPAEGGPAPTGLQPIFIVGMPRSGTTLLESALSAHSRVIAGGERVMMRELLEACLTGGALPNPAQCRQWAADYLQEAPAAGAADHLTDKHPLNFEAVGLIARLFPDAPILHVRRNPRETALSIFRHEFSKFWTFAHRLEDIGHYYGQYARLMAHWERIHPGRVLTLQYEDLARDFDAAIPAVLTWCGLDWEPQCGGFQSAPRPISTFSAVQAREPVTIRIGKADRYQRHLAPLLDALEAAGVDPETGALRPPY